MTEKYTPEELMATIISREIKDNTVVAVGTFSPIPATGALLAQSSHAPSAKIIIMGSKEYWPFNDGNREFFDYAQQGNLDYFFLSGAQIDKYGDINLHSIGSYEKPKVRLPGGAGSAMLYYMAKKVILFKPDHSARSLVEKVDFISSKGHSPEGVYRPGRLHKLITAKCLMSLNDEDNTLKVDSIHPGITEEDLKENTGFELSIKKDIEKTTPPSREELSLLRSKVKEEISSIYPQFAKKAFTV